jgi:hypothetical protein
MSKHWISLILIVIFLFSCDDNQYLELFRDTEVWELAKAVDYQNIKRINNLIQNENNPVNFQEPVLGLSLLHFSVMSGYSKSAKVLLKHGADPNMANTSNGITPFMYAASRENTELLELLLNYGGDVNSEALSEEKELHSTPLIAAVSGGLDNIVLLIKADADVNYKTRMGDTVLNRAFMRGGVNIDIPYYLLFNVGADIESATYLFPNGNEVRLVDRMRMWRFPIGSEKHKKKMEIAEYLKVRGQDYWATPVPEHLYNIYSKEYLEEY